VVQVHQARLRLYLESYMIVRAVVEQPELLDRFDWFNDGKDTIAWLNMMLRQGRISGIEPLIDYMEAELTKYHQLRHEEWAKQQDTKTYEQVLRDLLRKL